MYALIKEDFENKLLLIYTEKTLFKEIFHVAPQKAT